MSEVMTPMSFEQLVEWVLQEKKKRGTVFGQHHAYRADGTHNRTMFGRTLETPIGPAAGPHTQMTQNIVAAYYAGSRFFELKTVQIMDGEELAACINRPCIKADDEGYNCEWSTELTVPQAMEEYIKAWFLLKVIAKEFGLGDMNGFQFNVSVGYDLAGIQSPKVDTFLNSMKHAEDTEIFKHCKAYLLEHADWFEHVTTEDIEQIPPEICNSVTLSTLHGCPPQEIERIAMYLLTEKGFHTFVKCNPTLLGYEFARKTMDEMGYDYIQFGDFHFKDDLQYEDAVPMLTRLMNTAKERNLEFGVKITNTFPVDVKQNELPSEEMYMSGKSLYPLSISLAAKLAKEFDGRLRISYSGGADYYNIERIVDAGIWPVTVATTLLKPGGYQRLTQMAKLLDKENAPFEKVDAESAGKLAEEAVKDPHHVKAMKPLPSRKMKKEVPLMDCFVAPCKEGCPIHQDITTYLQLVGEEKYEEAMEVITEKNPLPFITGTICAHNCMSKCTRNFYETPVHIREMKLKAAENGYEALLEKLPVPAVTKAGKAAVIGGGPAGMAAAYFLRKGGMEVTLFEAKESLGGVVRHVIPPFRISEDAIEKDAEILRKMQVDIRCNTKVESLEELKKQGYTKIVLAVGAPVQGSLKLESGMPKNALEFLADVSNGDARSALNAIELGILTTERSADGLIHITLDVASECIQKRVIKYDKNGDSHYDNISAFIKSMRGSDPDAAVYYLAKMLYAGEDVTFIARRIMICASEDVGNADPNALTVAVSAAQAVERLGMPEARIVLAQAVTYVASAPKSNAAYMAVDQALESVRNHKIGAVPNHLRDAHYKGAAKLGHGIGYKYAHDYPDHYVKQQYLPDELLGTTFYEPTENGYEKNIKEYLERIRK